MKRLVKVHSFRSSLTAELTAFITRNSHEIKFTINSMKKKRAMSMSRFRCSKISTIVQIVFEFQLTCSVRIYRQLSTDLKMLYSVLNKARNIYVYLFSHVPSARLNELSRNHLGTLKFPKKHHLAWIYQIWLWCVRFDWYNSNVFFKQMCCSRIWPAESDEKYKTFFLSMVKTVEIDCFLVFVYCQSNRKNTVSKS